MSSWSVFTRLCRTVGIFLRIAELQRVLRHLGLRQGLELAAVEKVDQARLGRHLHVVARGGDHPLVLFEVLVEDHLAGFGALDPEIVGNLAAAQHGIDPRAHVIGNPVHLANS
jgi:hypothetical protein